MRRFRFTGNPQEYYRWDFPPVYDKVYNKEEYCKIRGGLDSPYVFETIVPDLPDWKEVFSEESTLSFQELRDNVIQWAKDKNLLKPENQLKQFAKMVSEVGELGDALIKEDHPEVIDALGDVQVCLMILCEQLGLNPTQCLESAWNVIKDRKGRNLNGTFIKD